MYPLNTTRTSFFGGSRDSRECGHHEEGGETLGEKGTVTTGGAGAGWDTSRRKAGH